MVVGSSEFHVTLKRAHRAHFFQLEIRPKKAGHCNVSEKRESGMVLKKREFTPKSGTVDTYGILRSVLISVVPIILFVSPSSTGVRSRTYPVRLLSLIHFRVQYDGNLLVIQD